MEYPHERLLEDIHWWLELGIRFWLAALVFGAVATLVFGAANAVRSPLQNRHEWQTPQKETGPVSTIAWAAGAAYLATILFGPSVTAWVRRRRDVREVARCR